ncbi:MAG: type I-E CRISPR-associated protein Cse1/CasA [Chloroflexota bacterium]|nr:type I-E CRISPR-associated protein Cse1/CasA [Chloroflexota bacterium]
MQTDLFVKPKPWDRETTKKRSTYCCNILRQPVISVAFNGRVSSKTLPEVYADLVNDRVDDFPYVRPHQRHFWHTTLCQIGTIAMVNAGPADLLHRPEEWEEVLRNLTREQFPDDDPWRMVNPDITRPAFLQSPASAAEKISDYNKILETPTGLDLPVASKHHDLRELDIRQATPEMWLFALAARQAGGGYDGPRLYEVSRMNSGSGNRHGFSLTPSTRWGPHIRRDIRVLTHLCQANDVKNLLLWTRPWDGTKQEQIPLDSLTPLELYVDVSRRIRLELDPQDRITARYATSESPRVHAKEVKGLTRDPWTITETDKAVTVASAGFGYRQVTNYLNPGKCTLPVLAKPSQADGQTDTYLVARALARGQGKTEGYHERIIPLNRKATGMLRGPATQRQLHIIAESRVKYVGEVQSILGHAVKTYLQNGKSAGKTKNEHQEVINNARRRLEQAVDQRFWQDLQDELDSQEPERTKWEWSQQVPVQLAREILASVCQSGLCRHADRYKAITEATGLFERRTATSKKLPSKPEEKE